MFYWVLRYSKYKNSIKGKGKASWREAEKGLYGWKLQKRLERGGLSCAQTNDFIVFVDIPDIL